MNIGLFISRMGYSINELPWVPEVFFLQPETAQEKPLAPRVSTNGINIPLTNSLVRLRRERLTGFDCNSSNVNR